MLCLIWRGHFVTWCVFARQNLFQTYWHRTCHRRLATGGLNISPPTPSVPSKRELPGYTCDSEWSDLGSRSWCLLYYLTDWVSLDLTLPHNQPWALASETTRWLMTIVAWWVIREKHKQQLYYTTCSRQVIGPPSRSKCPSLGHLVEYRGFSTFGAVWHQFTWKHITCYAAFPPSACVKIKTQHASGCSESLLFAVTALSSGTEGQQMVEVHFVKVRTMTKLKQ